MFNCAVSVFLPVVAPGKDEPWRAVIAQYNFDPGLMVGDEVEIVDAPLCTTKVDGRRVQGSSPKFTFRGKVVSREKVILPNTYNHETDRVTDAFEIQIVLEIADKEHIGQMAEVMKEKFGMTDYSPPALQDE